MQLFFLKGRKGFLLVLILTILIVGSIATIFYIDNKPPTSSGGNLLQDTLALKGKINSLLLNDPNDPNRSDGSRVLQKFSILEDSQAAEKERYEALIVITNFAQSIYSDTHNPEYYSLINEDIAGYAKKYFPNIYNENYFLYSCQDPTCAEEEQPAEILAVIEEIKSSDFPDEVKETLSEDLLNAGYRSKEENPGKVRQYLIIAEMIRRNENFSATGQNIKIADDIENYVKNKFPVEYKEANENS